MQWVPFQQQGIQVGGTFYGSKGTQPAYGVATVEGGTIMPVGPKPDVAASIVVNLSCDSNSQGGAYYNFVGQNQVMVTINSAGDGLDGGITTFDALDKANAFVKTYAETGDVQKAVDAANKELAAIPGSEKQNEGDTINAKKVN